MPLELIVSVGVLYFLGALPSPPAFLATLAAVVFNVFAQMPIGNWASLWFPRKQEFGQMRGQRSHGMATLLFLSVQIVIGGFCAGILLLGRWTGHPWLPAGIFVVLTAAAIAVYFFSLEPLAALAEKRKELLIDALCR
jgi:fatty acid desaturase